MSDKAIFHVLIIEDSATIRNVMAHKLREAGFSCEMAETAEIGLALLEKQIQTDLAFQGLLLDWVLPGMSGAQLMQQLMDDEKFQSLAIMVMTDHPDNQAFKMVSQRENNDIQLKSDLELLPYRFHKFIQRFQNHTIKVPSSPQVIEWAENNKEIANTKTSKVLFVDDSASVRAKFNLLLENNGYQVILAEDMSSAIQLAREHHPDIAIIDYLMPNGNGDELIKALADFPETQGIASVMHSERRDVLELALDAGAMDLIYKDDPVNVFLMRLKAIEHVIIAQRQMSQLQLFHLTTEKLRVGVMLQQDADIIPFNGTMKAFIDDMGLKRFKPNNNQEILEFSTYDKKLKKNRSFNQIPLYSPAIGEIVLFQEITELTDQRQALEQAFDEMEYQATHDSLTRLANRRLLLQSLNQQMASSKRNKKRLALLAIDLDRFKAVNDSFGHDAGDQLLIQVSALLSENRRETDIVARIGGDEFLIVLSNIDDTDAVMHICDRLLEQLNTPFDLKGNWADISASIGIAIFPDDANNIEELEKKADLALYQVKQSGRGAFRFYDEEMHTLHKRQIELENQLRHALENHEFSMNFQPRVDLKTNKIVGMEALMRWHNKTLGAISPEEFIPLLEKMNLISEVTLVMLKESFTCLKEWLTLDPLLLLSVNLSPLQIQTEMLAAQFAQLIEECGLLASNVEVEITEGVFLNEDPQALETLQTIGDAGCLISLDDFGTGYSSLSYLKRLPIDILKIDRVFIRDILSDKDDRNLTEAILGLAKIFDLEVVAEGIETKEQKQLLETLGCQYYQGYYFSKPQRPEVMTQMIKENLQTDKSRTAD